MTELHRPQGGGHPGDSHGGPRDHVMVRVDGHDYRARVDSEVRAAIDRRVAAESPNNRSAWLRPALAYAARYMPVGWTEEEQARPAS